MKKGKILEKDIKYSFDADNNAHVVGYNGAPIDIVIPSVMSNTEGSICNVISIKDEAFMGCSTITKVTLPSTIESIGVSAFDGCTKLKEINIPTELRQIHKFAFYNCKSLETINLNANLREIGVSAFQNCESLTEVKIHYGIPEIKGWTFAGCSSLRSVDLPNGVKEIHHQAFAYCYELKTITTMSSETVLGHEVFYQINPECVIVVPLFCSYRYKNINQWSVFQIREAEEFSQNGIRYKLISQENNNYNVIVSRNLNFRGVATIPTMFTFLNKNCNVVEIEKSAFKDNQNLTSVHIAETIEHIGEDAFANCDKLQYFTTQDLTESKYIAIDGVLYRKKEKDTVGYPSILFAYPAAKENTAFVVKYTIKEINSYAFSGFRYLERIVFNSTNPPTFGENVFHNVVKERCKIFVPKGQVDEYKKENQLSGFDITDSDEFVVAGINYKILSENTVEVSNNRQYKGSANIPPTVTYAGVEYTVTAIGEQAFYENKQLTAINFPNTIKEIKDLAVAYCSNNLTIPISLPPELEYVGYFTFAYAKFKDLDIPNSVKVISKSAFSYSDVESKLVLIQENVESIGESAFYGCDFSEYRCSVKNKNYCSKDGVLYNKDCSLLIHYPRFKSNAEFVIPQTVSAIGNSVFENNYIKKLILSENTKKLERAALWACPALTKLVVKATIPPIVEDEGLAGVEESCTILVPNGCIGVYKQAPGWKEFRIQEVSYKVSYFVVITKMGRHSKDIINYLRKAEKKHKIVTIELYNERKCFFVKYLNEEEAVSIKSDIEGYGAEVEIVENLVPKRDLNT